MKIPLKTGILLACLLILFILGFRWFRSADVVPSDIEIKEETGGILKVSEPDGKYLVVSYVQSWCGDCYRELPSLSALQSKIGKERLQVVLVSDEDWQKIHLLQKRSESDLPFFRSAKEFSDYGIRYFPTTVLLSPERKVLMIREEGYDWNGPEVHRLIQ